MSNNYTALFIDTVSIQEYIFYSNRLKENIGASYLVDSMYGEPLSSAMADALKLPNVDLSGWEREPDKPLFADGGEYDVGYIGGGNALIFLKEKEKTKPLITAFSRTLLTTCPGLKTSFGFVDDFDVDRFPGSFGRINESAHSNRNVSRPVVSLVKYGITSDCPLSGDSAEIEHRDVDGTYISSMSHSKLMGSIEATRRLREMVSKVLPDEFTFTDLIDKLGQTRGKNYAAVVHIDGNSMGARFQTCETLTEFRRLSMSVRNATAKAFEMLIEDVVDKIRSGVISASNGFDLGKDDKGKTILPLRPIVIGGDDITFVCDGRLAFYLTEKFMAAFSEQPVSHGSMLSSCAGVAIVKTKYPFYKAYTLAEELSGRAKRASRSKPDSSYVDFYVSSGGFTGTVVDIFENHLSSREGLLHYGPYRIDKSDEVDSVSHLEERIEGFRRWPATKLNTLREVLLGSAARARSFVREEKVKGNVLPAAGPIAYQTEVWIYRKTPYSYAIELFDFYPDELRGEAI